MASPFDELMTRPRRRERVILAWDPSAASTHNEARLNVRRLERLTAKDGVPADAHEELVRARARLAEIEAEMQTVRFEFESIGPKAVDALMTKYPPSREQIEKFKADGGSGRLQYDPDRYVPALIAATCFEIETPSGKIIESDEITVDAISALLDRFSTADQVRLYNAAQIVDIDGTSVEALVKGSAETRS